MVDFRRWAIAMALLVAVAGLASAQVQPQSCQTNVAVTPTLRSEGYTEQTGDITITCVGGANIGINNQIPQVNIALFYNSQVTSRLIPVSGLSNNISEALLLLDDPGAGTVTGQGVASQYGLGQPFGTAAPQVLCTTPTTGCAAFVSVIAPGANSVFGTATQVAVATSVPSGTSTAANVFQGIVAGNSITFFGIPILAPVTSGASRTIRITNARVNASSLGGGSASGATPVIASISISGATSLLISNATPTVGFVQGGLTTAASGSTGLNQCTSSTIGSVNTLTFSENFPTAFKTRVNPQTNNSYAGQALPGAAPNNQNIPGTIYNSESNFVFPVPNGTAGLADFGTRLKATFNNVPAGVRIFVSTANVNNNASPVGAPAVIGGTATSPTYAQLVNSETVSDGNAGISGFFPSVTSTTFGPNNGNVPIAEITVLNGTATAVWEIVNTNPNSNESVKFAVYETFVSNVAQNTPPPGTATVSMSYAPTPPAFSASSGAVASSALTIPRFTAGTGSSNIFAINICRTVLLYPYVTNISGFDTGLAIANTSTDPFGTGAQAGSCDLNWYQGTNNPAKGNSGTIASGTIYTTLASTAVPGFNGYMIAVCNFQFAHGFAFVSDVGARNLAMGYLAVVLPDPGNNGGSRNASAPGCGSTSGGNGGVSCGTGEADGH